jgi:hypothetical protein
VGHPGAFVPVLAAEVVAVAVIAGSVAALRSRSATGGGSVYVFWALGPLAALAAGVVGLSAGWDATISWSCIALAAGGLGHLVHDAIIGDSGNADGETIAKAVDENLRWLGGSAATILGLVVAFANERLVPAGRCAVASLAVAIGLSTISYANYERLKKKDRTPTADPVNGVVALLIVWSFLFGLILLAGILVGGNTLTEHGVTARSAVTK